MVKKDPVTHASEVEAKSKWENVLKETAEEADTIPEQPAPEDQPSAEPEIAPVQDDVEQVETGASSYAELKKALEDAQNQIVHLQEKLQSQALYAQAELQNAQRRASLDVTKEKQYAGEKTIEAFLPLIDSYEKSLEQTTTVEQFQEGTRRIMALMHQIFEKLGVKEIAPQVGEAFDPHYHEAMATQTVEPEKQQPNTIVQVFQKGYALHKRLVRPAMVIVSKVEGD